MTMLVTTLFIELAFEGLIDAYALHIESLNGIDVDIFWEMWKQNAGELTRAEPNRTRSC